MNVQEAYNAGLNKAEDTALKKLSKALEGVDDGPFENPKMEEFRQTLLQRVSLTVDVGASNVDSSDVIEVDYLKKVLMYDPLPPILTQIGSEKYKVATALSHLIHFIYPRALKGHNGSKNYIKMISQIREDLGLTSDENVVN